MSVLFLILQFLFFYSVFCERRVDVFGVRVFPARITKSPRQRVAENDKAAIHAVRKISGQEHFQVR